MVKIQYVKGDLLNSDCDVIAHGCNALGVMGAGIALQIKKKWPRVYEIYREHYEHGDLKLGHILFVQLSEEEKPFLIANLITQAGIGKGLQINYAAIKTAFEGMFVFFAHAYPGKTLGIPKIGAGLGGGDWTRIESIVRGLIWANPEWNFTLKVFYMA